MLIAPERGVSLNFRLFALLRSPDLDRTLHFSKPSDVRFAPKSHGMTVAQLQLWRAHSSTFDPVVESRPCDAHRSGSLGRAEVFRSHGRFITKALTAVKSYFNILRMALLERRKREELPVLPARQVLCYGCSERVFADNGSGFPPPYCCVSCRGTWTGKAWVPPAGQRQVGGKERGPSSSRRWREERPSKPELRRLKIQEREEEIFSKPLDQLTKAEKDWLLEVDRFLHPKTPAGRPKEECYQDWFVKIARAEILGTRRPTLQELADLKKPSADSPLHVKDTYTAKVERLRDAFKKAKKYRQLPVPPMS